MKIGKLIYSLSNKIAHKIPAPLLGFFSMPIGYQLNSRDALMYESTRMINIAFAFCMNNKIAGDFAEFGVYKGTTSIEAYRSAKLNGFNNMKFFAFDSFEGLPEIDGSDAGGGVFHSGQFAFSRSNYENNLKKNGVQLSSFEIVQGYFNLTLPVYKGGDKISIAWVDCDLYESTIPVLDFLTERLVDGSILIFDDWYCFAGDENKGEQLACKEWLQRNPQIKLTEYQKFHWAGIAFIVSKS